MLKYLFVQETNPESNDNERNQRGRMVAFPDIVTVYGRRAQIVGELSLKLRDHFNTLIQAGQKIPVITPEGEDVDSIYMPAVTTWRILLWNEFVNRKMTLVEIARTVAAKESAPEGCNVLTYVHRVFDLRESSKYLELIPFAHILELELTAGVTRMTAPEFFN